MTHLIWQLWNLEKKEIEIREVMEINSSVIGIDYEKQKRENETALTFSSLVLLPEIWTTDEQFFEK